MGTKRDSRQVRSCTSWIRGHGRHGFHKSCCLAVQLRGEVVSACECFNGWAGRSGVQVLRAWTGTWTWTSGEGLNATTVRYRHVGSSQRMN